VVKAPIEEDRSTTTRISPCQGQFAEDPPHATATACIGSRAGAQVSHQIKHFAERLPATLIYPGIDIGAKITPADTESTTAAPATAPRSIVTICSDRIAADSKMGSE
jgi:hypothetical protein